MQYETETYSTYRRRVVFPPVALEEVPNGVEPLRLSKSTGIGFLDTTPVRGGR